MRSRLVALGTLLVLATAGCGGEAAQEVVEQSPDPVVAAAGHAADEETAALSLTMAVGDQTVTGEGAFDLIDGDRGELTLTVPTPTPTTVELRVVDDVVYVMAPGLEAQHPGKRWVRVDPAAAGTAPAGTLGVQNPTELIGLLESATDFEETGTATVRGEEMALWSGTLDLAELAGDAGVGQRLDAMGVGELPAEVAIDDEDRLRMVTFTLDLAAVAEAAGQPLPDGAPAEMVLTIEVHDFGIPVDVQAPPADEVVDAPAPKLLPTS